MLKTGSTKLIMYKHYFSYAYLSLALAFCSRLSLQAEVNSRKDIISIWLHQAHNKIKETFYSAKKIKLTGPSGKSSSCSSFSMLKSDDTCV